MLENLNIEEIKKYNSSLKQCRDRAAALNAEIEYTRKEIDNSCAEISAELGITVTRDNLEQIYNEQLEKINSTLQSGNAVLMKIMNEENSQAQSMMQQQPMMAQAPVPPVQMQQPVPPVPPVAPAPAPVFSQPQVGGESLPNFFGN